MHFPNKRTESEHRWDIAASRASQIGNLGWGNPCPEPWWQLWAQEAATSPRSVLCELPTRGRPTRYIIDEEAQQAGPTWHFRATNEASLVLSAAHRPPGASGSEIIERSPLRTGAAHSSPMLWGALARTPTFCRARKGRRLP